MKEKIENILMEELNYSEFEAAVTASDLINLQPQLHEALWLWVKERRKVNVVVGDYSALQLMENKGFTYPAALIALDWVLTEPDIAKAELAKDIYR